jgi:hypothetical protein
VSRIILKAPKVIILNDKLTILEDPFIKQLLPPFQKKGGLAYIFICSIMAKLRLKHYSTTFIELPK